MTKRALTEAERAERRRADRERLDAAARALLSSEGWRQWVRVRSTNGLARYSFHNQLLIALQRPDATYVAGFRAFLDLNRCVRKGERAIRILAPMSVRTRARGPSARPAPIPASSDALVFRAVSVFDVSQTDPLPDREPLPLGPPSQPPQGDSHAHLLAPLSDSRHELGYVVQTRALEGSADGWCDATKS